MICSNQYVITTSNNCIEQGYNSEIYLQNFALLIILVRRSILPHGRELVTSDDFIFQVTREYNNPGMDPSGGGSRHA